MSHHQFAIRPVRDRIQPGRATMQDKQRNPETCEEHTLQNLKDRDDLEIANAPLRSQHLGDGGRLAAHARYVSQNLARSQAAPDFSIQISD